MRIPPSPGEVSVQCHFEEITGRVDAVIVQRELLREEGYSIAGLFQGYLARLPSTAHMEFTVNVASTSRVCRHELAHGIVAPTIVLLELNLGHDYVILQHGATVGTHGIATGIVRFYVCGAAVLALVTTRHCGRHERRGKYGI